MGCCGSRKKRASTPDQTADQLQQDKSGNQFHAVAGQKPKVGFWRRLFGY
ncbi:hypothetical protein M9194_09110 [Vibrio sp. S4M6]|nr:hypothetical protein [Vibrio sinus]MCL9781583.1 hypothetical protein [Vibrio sinus]